MGALAVLLRRLRVPLGQVGMLIAINLVITFLIPGISVAGHLGGLSWWARRRPPRWSTPRAAGRRCRRCCCPGSRWYLAVVALSMASMG